MARKLTGEKLTNGLKSWFLLVDSGKKRQKREMWTNKWLEKMILLVSGRNGWDKFGNFQLEEAMGSLTTSGL